MSILVPCKWVHMGYCFRIGNESHSNAAKAKYNKQLPQRQGMTAKRTKETSTEIESSDFYTKGNLYMSPSTSISRECCCLLFTLLAISARSCGRFDHFSQIGLCTCTSCAAPTRDFEFLFFLFDKTQGLWFSGIIEILAQK